MQGDRLFSKIIHDHAESIRALRLDDMTATKETLVRLLSRCTRLEELGLKVLKDRGVPLVSLLRMPLGPSTMTSVSRAHLALLSLFPPGFNPLTWSWCPALRYIISRKSRRFFYK